ncbi:MAG TPA: MFS transporter [Nocardioidaceae bacterium]|nr:MFS transporter [Nocardioidaceae bacterium]
MTGQVEAATRATYVAFIGAGFAFASWASRIPQVKAHLHLSPSELGLVLFALAAGSVISLPLSGRVVGRWGSRRVVGTTAVALALGLAVAAVGYLFGVVPVVIGLFVFGLANGGWDVAMNVQAAEVERRAGSAIMSRFHAGFSVGTVGGALLGAVMVAFDVPVTAHLAAVAVVVGVAVPLSVRGFLADHPVSSVAHPRRAAWAPWLEPRTLLIGVFVLAFAFAEGTGNDWIGVAVIDGYHAAPVLGTLTFAAFLAAMTVGRWFGPALLDRYGRVPVVRAIAVLGVVGLAVFVLGGSTAAAFGGAVLWGAGVSLGFPVGMSAGADDPARAASRVSVVASIGYCAFLAGPPLVGILGERFTVLHALTAVAVLLGLAALIASSVRPLSVTR